MLYTSNCNNGHEGRITESANEIEVKGKKSMKQNQIHTKTLAKHEQATSNSKLSHEIEQFKFKPHTHTYTNSLSEHTLLKRYARIVYKCIVLFVTLRLFAR